MGFARNVKGGFLIPRLLDFSENDLLGSVTYVDTEQIIIEIENTAIMRQICVGNIVAIETSKQHKHLIALIDKVTLISKIELSGI